MGDLFEGMGKEETVARTKDMLTYSGYILILTNSKAKSKLVKRYE